MRYLIRYTILTGLVLCLAPRLEGQAGAEGNSEVTKGVIRGTDTIPMVELPEVRVYQRRDYEYLYLKRRYRRLILNVKRAYPYAKIAGIKLKELDDQLVTLSSEKEKKDYIEQAEKEIMAEFEKEVRRLTVTQGIILVKLIDRETGRTSYQVIRELRGRLTAFFWQGIARIFGNNLKAEYDPDNKDRIIEDIVRGIEAGFI